MESLTRQESGELVMRFSFSATFVIAALLLFTSASCNLPERTEGALDSQEHAQCGWVLTWGGPENDRGSALAVDTDGRVYIAGSSTGSVDFDPNSEQEQDIIICGHRDGFLACYDSVGKLIWVKTWESEGGISCCGIALDGEGNIFVAGHYLGTADLDPGQAVSLQPSYDPSGWGMESFLSKFDLRGNFQWGLSWGATGCKGIAVDKDGMLYVVGEFRGSVDFDPGPGNHMLHDVGDYDVYLSKFDNDGNHQWTWSWGGENDDAGRAVALDAEGYVYVTGNYGGDHSTFGENIAPKPMRSYSVTYAVPYHNSMGWTASSGNDLLEWSGDSDAFLAKLSPSGGLLWTRRWGGREMDVGRDVAIGSQENVLVVGSYMGTADFDPGDCVEEHSCNGGQDGFLSSFDSNGQYNWSRQSGSDSVLGAAGGNSLAVHAGANINAVGYLTVNLEGTIEPGPAGIPIPAIALLHLSGFDRIGGRLWEKVCGEARADVLAVGHDVVVDVFGNIYVAGIFEGTVDFDLGQGNYERSSSGGSDVFLLKIPPDAVE